MQRLTICVALVLLCRPALGISPCPDIECDPTKPDGPRKCAAKAEWIMEGTIEAVTETYGCGTYGCASSWQHGTIALSDRKIIKGNVRPGFPREVPLTIATAPQICGNSLVRINPALIGQRVRFFGTQAGRTDPGFFAFEMVSQ